MYLKIADRFSSNNLHNSTFNHTTCMLLAKVQTKASNKGYFINYLLELKYQSKNKQYYSNNNKLSLKADYFISSSH